jgi:hypothetical protein
MEPAEPLLTGDGAAVGILQRQPGISSELHTRHRPGKVEPPSNSYRYFLLQALADPCSSHNHGSQEEVDNRSERERQAGREAPLPSTADGRAALRASPTSAPTTGGEGDVGGGEQQPCSDQDGGGQLQLLLALHRLQLLDPLEEGRGEERWGSPALGEWRPALGHGNPCAELEAVVSHRSRSSTAVAPHRPW